MAIEIKGSKSGFKTKLDLDPTRRIHIFDFTKTKTNSAKIPGNALHMRSENQSNLFLLP